MRRARTDSLRLPKGRQILRTGGLQSRKWLCSSHHRRCWTFVGRSLARTICLRTGADDVQHAVMHYIEVPVVAAADSVAARSGSLPQTGRQLQVLRCLFQDGAERRFDPPTGGMGDYQCGGSAMVDDNIVHVVQWAEPEGIRMNYFVHSLVTAPPSPPTPPFTCDKLKAWLDTPGSKGDPSWSSLDVLY
jgi:hypothetical protein